MSKWVGHIPDDVVEDMANIAPMLAHFGEFSVLIQTELIIFCLQAMILMLILQITEKLTKLLLTTQMTSRSMMMSGKRLQRRSRVSARRTQCPGEARMMKLRILISKDSILKF